MYTDCYLLFMYFCLFLSLYSQLVSGGVEGTLVEGPGTETRSEDTEVNTGDTRQLDGVGEQVDDKEQVRS